ncbi:MAG: hypothetical protein IJE07_04220 [Clostridia bacterium]|nr:hypothetical protein [Clostridia bacterium]
MKRAKVLAGFWVRLIGFVLALVMLLSYTIYVLTPKHDYGICPIMNFYTLPENSVDVLVIGTSCAYAGVNTNVLWEEHGLAVYNLCGAELPYWVAYSYLEEALKTQQPKVLIIDAKASIYTADYSKRGRTILATSGIRDLSVRLKAIAACVASEDFMGYALVFPQLHSYYTKVNAESFIYPPTNGGRGEDWMGYIEMDKTETHQKPSLVWTNIKKPINARQEEYFRKILELANEHGIPTMLVGFPNPDYANDHMYYNTLWGIAEEYGVSGINYNDPDLRLRLYYSSNFADWQHLNVEGSVIFSRRLGSDLRENYPDLPDRRGEEGWERWQSSADAWYVKYPDYLPEEE